MLELLLFPTTALTIAFVSDRFKNKIDDKKKIQVFFEVSGIAIKKMIRFIIQNLKSELMMIEVQHTCMSCLLVCQVKLFERLKML